MDHPNGIDVERDLARPDEWGPTLRMEPANTGYNNDTPKNWPAASAFPAGAPMKEPTTDYWYNRESTLGETQQMRPKSALPDRLRRTLEKEKTALIQLNATVKKERLELAMSQPRPGSAPAGRRKKGKTRDENTKCVRASAEGRKGCRGRSRPATFLTSPATFLASLATFLASPTTFLTFFAAPFLPYSLFACRLLGKNATLNYWGEMSASVKRELRPEHAKLTLGKHHATQHLASEMKWMLLKDFYRCYKRSNRGGPPKPGLQDLHELAALFIAR
jgi:hypothetical protein